MGLPSDYRQLTYVESTGSQYINTGFTPNGKSKIEMQIAITNYSANNCFFCARDAASGTDAKSFTAFYIKGTSSAAGYYRFDFYGKSKSSSSAEDANVITNLIAENGTLTIGSFTITTSSSSSSSNMPWILLASSTSSSISSINNAAKAKLYSCKIYDDGVLVRDFVPCNNPSNVAGLYDLIGNKFYPSASSTALIAGPYTNIKTGDILNCDYTGAVQTVTLPKGIYKLECWGAQGGYRSGATYGGYGGYSVGTLILDAKTQIFIYSGGSGNTGGTSGGFNGGGRRQSYNGGGGASDIRIGQDSLYARVIVAAGGGSDGATNKTGMYGGGETGGSTTENYGTGGYGGTQTGVSSSSWQTTTQSTSTSNQSGAYAGFGFGGNGITSSSGYGGAGGGGWYGGSGAYPDGSGDDDRGGGGGSGYVYTSSTASNYPSGCLLNSAYYLTEAKTIAGNASMPSTAGSTETGHQGNGYVRITVIKAQSLNIPVNIGSSWKSGDAISVNIGGTWKQGESAYVNINGTWKELS